MSKSRIDPKLITLLGRGPIHPALHADERGVVVGRVTEKGRCELLTSDRRRFALGNKKIPLRFPLHPYPDLAARWADADVDDFLAGGAAPRFAEVLALAMHAFDQMMEFPRDEMRSLVATWTVATYFHQALLAFPRLTVSGEKGSGKSKLLMLLAAIGFNGLYMVTPSAAVLFRLVHAYRPTMILDEMERLSKDDAPEILAVVNAGYKAGGSVPRCEGEGVKRVVPFEVYGPMAFAAIRSVNAVSEDRAIPIVLQRGRDQERINAEVDRRAPIYGRIRAACHRLLLSRWREVADAVAAFQCPAQISGRARELWRPLLAIARLADQDGELDVEQDLRRLALEHVADRDGVSAEGEALLCELVERLGASNDVIVRPGELAPNLQNRLGWDRPPSAEAVAGWLRRFGFPKAKPPRDSDGVRYQVARDHLTLETALYAPHLNLHTSTVT